MTIAMLVFLLGLASSGIVSAQTPFGPPDGRYQGYPRTLISWPSAPPDLNACVAGEYYEPFDVHLMQYTSRVKVAGTRTSDYDECRWMRTRNGDRWVLRPKGTKYAVDAAGRDLFDMGSPNGKACGNPTPFGIAIKPPAPTVAALPPPPPPAVEPPPPAPVPQLPPLPPVRPRLVRLPPPPPDDEGAEFIWSVGTGVLGGPVNFKYFYPDPRRGYVPKRNNFITGVFTARAETVGHTLGAYASLTTSFLGDTWRRQYQDIRGRWERKERNADDSRNKLLNIKLGGKLAGEDSSVGVGVNYRKFGDRELYFAQNTRTDTQLWLETWGLDLEATLGGEHVDDPLIIRFEGTRGLGGKRKKWTDQFHQGPPAIDFPRVTDRNQDAKHHRFAVTVNGRIWGPLRAFGGFEWSTWKTFEPDVHPSNKRIRLFGYSGGLKLGR